MQPTKSSQNEGQPFAHTTLDSTSIGNLTPTQAQQTRTYCAHPKSSNHTPVWVLVAVVYSGASDNT